MCLQHCLLNNQLLQNRKGEGSQLKAPASNNMGKRSERNQVCHVTLVSANKPPIRN